MRSLFMEERKLFPITEIGLFLNHAATSPISYATIARMHESVALMREPLGAHFYEALGEMEQTRRLLSELIGAHPREIAFTTNTSTALSLIAQAVKWRAGDRVLIPSGEFPSNLYVWQNLAARGVKTEVFTLQPGLDLVEQLRAVDLKDVRLISVSSVSYRTGRRHDTAAFARFCREHSIYSCVDAIQEVGATSVHVHESGVDFLAGGAQKWLLGPIGCGYFYAREALLGELEVPVVGWTSVRYPENFLLKKIEFAPEMTRFEPGLPGLMSIEGLRKSLAELGAIGWSRIFARLSELRQFTALMAEREGYSLLTHARDEVAAITSFALPSGTDHRRLAEVLHERQVSVTVRDGYCRVSPHFYSQESEIERFFEELRKALGRAASPAPLLRTSQKEPHTVSATAAPRRALITGASGHLGHQIALRLKRQGYALTCLVRESSRVSEDLGPVTRVIADLSSPEAVEQAVRDLKASAEKFHILVHAAGDVESDTFVQTRRERFREIQEVNFLAPARLTQAFLADLKASDAQGVLSIVSSSGRCGFPLLSAYASASGGLWTLGEVVDREIRSDGMWMTTYVAPAMHSPLQKKLGRIALRYFKMGGAFDYEIAERVSQEALDAFFALESLRVARLNRFKIWINALMPSVISRRVAKVWKV